MQNHSTGWRSSSLRRLAAAVPWAARPLLRRMILRHLDQPERLHWLAQTVSADLGYRAPFVAKLGNGMDILVAANDLVGREIILHGFYEPATVNIVSALLKPGMTFFDVGAHVGQYTLIASALVGSSGQVHSFEPDPQTCVWLRSNVERNHLANVHVVESAVSSSNAPLDLWLSSSTNIGANSIHKPDEFSGRKVTVHSTRLEDYIATIGARPDLMKLDVEGAEIAALDGLGHLLEDANAPALIVEFCSHMQESSGASSSALSAYLERKGYELFRVTDSGLVEYVPKIPEESYFNVLASKSQDILDTDSDLRIEHN